MMKRTADACSASCVEPGTTGNRSELGASEPWGSLRRGVAAPRAKTLAALLLLAASLLLSCAKNGVPVDENEIPIACRMNALTQQERAREGELLQEHLASVRETRERDDGYSFRYPSDPALFPRMAELVTLEHRCCPFLNFRLDWSGNDDAPWLHVTGGARVKSFVADTFGKPPLKAP